MGKPAARVGDMTAHGGVVTGPGCPTVLIGKMPAAQIGNMHVCPMVTPAPAPIPHIGGTVLGPVPPTVFIGKMPAACVGDMCMCVGPPSSILPPGCLTVLIGMAGGGGGGGGAGSAAAAAAASVLKASAPKTIKGLNAAPKATSSQAGRQASGSSSAAQGQAAQSGEAATNEQTERETEPELTLADIVEILTSIERDENYEAARFFASYLDYSKLTDMAKKFVSGEDTNANNDPNLMPTRFMLLYGADDAQLQTIDNHPDNFDGQPDHPINVANLRKGLKLLGYAVADTGPYNDEVANAHAQYIGSCNTGTSYPFDELEGESSSSPQAAAQNTANFRNETPTAPVAPQSPAPAAVSESRTIRFGDSSVEVQEISIRLSGFGGGVPSEVFDTVTELKVKSFERTYMKRSAPTGIVDKEVAQAIDAFSAQYPIDFAQIKCPCGKCGGFGAGINKNEFTKAPYIEAHHMYEYPGIHRSLLWAVKGILFALAPTKKVVFSSGYRCSIENKNKGRVTTNHMGKALDLHVYTNESGTWAQGDKAAMSNYVRSMCVSKLSAQTGWAQANRFSLEPSNIAPTWVHLDVRQFASKYLNDTLFCKNSAQLNGSTLTSLLS